MTIHDKVHEHLLGGGRDKWRTSFSDFMKPPEDSSSTKTTKLSSNTISGCTLLDQYIRCVVTVKSPLE